MSSISFAGAILRNATFHNASNKDNINFKLADLFSARISGELLHNAVSIEDAILPNRTRGIQPNLLSNGDAESRNCETNTSIPSSWYVEKISGNVSLSVSNYKFDKV